MLHNVTMVNIMIAIWMS